MVAWTVTEIIRYSFYTFSLLNHLPYLIKWARWSFSEFIVWLCLVENYIFCSSNIHRYTFFFVLYPMGVTGELLTIYAALPYVQKTGLYSITLPNKYNFSFDYHSFLILVMVSYIPSTFNSKRLCIMFWYLPSVNNLISRLILCIFEISRSSCLSCEWTALFLLMTSLSVFLSIPAALLPHDAPEEESSWSHGGVQQSGITIHSRLIAPKTQTSG